ncbi:MAG: hypothetical protein ABR975_07360 [Vulcanimicrobiaceae bacterium]|jgi:hypothetical protein
MPSSAEPARAVVVRTIIALERACLEAEEALVERRWRDVRRAFATQRKLTDELAALFAASPDVAPAADAKVAQRLHGVYAYRQEQMNRLESYRSSVGERLRTIGKMRQLSRSVGKRPPVSHVVNDHY